MKGEDKGQIESRTSALEQAAQSLHAAASAGAGGGDEGGASPSGGQADDVVDAEFTEVKDGEQK